MAKMLGFVTLGGCKPGMANPTLLIKMMESQPKQRTVRSATATLGVRRGQRTV
jgi:hypothetical protein